MQKGLQFGAVFIIILLICGGPGFVGIRGESVIQTIIFVKYVSFVVWIQLLISFWWVGKKTTEVPLNSLTYIVSSLVILKHQVLYEMPSHPQLVRLKSI